MIVADRLSDRHRFERLTERSYLIFFHACPSAIMWCLSLGLYNVSFSWSAAAYRGIGHVLSWLNLP